MTSVICDLDGVLYSGDEPIPGSSEALDELMTAGVTVWFATNNSTRTPSEVVAKIQSVSGVGVAPTQVITSALAAATLVAPEDSPVLILGGPGVAQALEDAGVELTEDPAEARCVVVGLDREITYQKLSNAVEAVRGGARFIATNDDPTLPTADGLRPGAGAIVAAIAAAADTPPEIAGKPNEPMRAMLRERIGGETWMIGDRVDTDIAMAALEPEWRSILVLTGVTGPDDHIGAADVVVDDLAEAAKLVLGDPFAQYSGDGPVGVTDRGDRGGPREAGTARSRTTPRPGHRAGESAG